MSVDATTGEAQAIGVSAQATPDAVATVGYAEAAGVRASSSDVATTGQLEAYGVAAETWYAIFVTATGQLMSVGTAVGTLPPEQEAVEIPHAPDDDEMWDEVTRTFVTRPEKQLVDRADDVLEELEQLSGEQRVAVREAVVKHFPLELRRRPWT